MAKLTIISVSEERAIPSGKKLKQIEVNKEGLDWNFNRVTVWEDHPAYDVLHEGMEITKSYIHETDQDKVNPNTGKPYKNYTLREGEEVQQGSTPKTDTNIDAKLNAIYALLKEIHEHTVGSKTHNEKAYEELTGKTYPDITDEQLEDPSQIPF